MPSPDAIRVRYLELRERLAAAAERSGRQADSVLLLIVTADVEPEHIRALVELGHIDFGEHRAQALLQRAASLEEFLGRHRTLSSERGSRIPSQVRWHMLGPIQRHKLRKLTDAVQLVHSVSNIRVAEELQAATLHRDKPAEILLQVNASLRKSEEGIALPAVAHVAELIHTMYHLRLRGLATTAPADADPEQARAAYRRCRELFEEISTKGVVGKDFSVLCMGSSADYEIAAEEGANIVRIGSALFAAAQARAARRESAQAR